MANIDIRENSNFGGMPIFMYRFSLGTQVWGYVNTDREFFFDGISHKPVPISTSSVKQTGDPTQDTLTVLLPDDTPVSQLFLGSGPSEDVYLVIKQTHFGSGESITHFFGTVTDRSVSKIGQATLTCKYISASFAKNGARLAYSRTCQHALYDSGCRINKADFAVFAALTYVDGANVQSNVFATKPDDWFSGGFIEWPSFGGVMNRRAIEKHVGSNFRIFGFTDGLQVGTGVTAYPGCLRTTDVCVGKFNNITNYGGFPGLPGKSPFDGDPVF